MTQKDTTTKNDLTFTDLAVASETAGPDWNAPLGDLVNMAVIVASNSKNTRRAYRQSIGQFFQYLSEVLGTERPIAETTKEGRKTVWLYRGTAAILKHLTPSVLDGFTVWLEASAGVSINTANARFYAVKTFLSVAYRDGYLTDAMAWRLNVTMFKRRVQRDNKPVGRRLSPSEVRKLRRAPDTDTLKGQRDLAILDCMLFAGLRRSEVASLKIGDIEVDNGRYWLIVTGKGRKTRRIKMHDTLYKSLTAWIDASDRASAHSQPIFVGMDRHGNLSGVAVNGSTVGRLVTQYGALSGLAPATAGELGKLSPLGAHDLRRTAARNAHDNGAPLLYIQKWLGHKDPKTTARYIGLGEDDSDTATDYVHY